MELHAQSGFMRMHRSDRALLATLHVLPVLLQAPQTVLLVHLSITPLQLMNALLVTHFAMNVLVH